MGTETVNGQAMATEQRTTPGQRRDDEDMRLIARIRTKDMAAFETLYRGYHMRLSRFLLRLVNRPQLVEEVLDDTLMVVWEKADSFNGASKLSTWIFAIAYRKAMKALRKQDDPIDDDLVEERVSLDPSPEEDVSHGRRRALLLQAMEALSPEHRAVINLTYFHEMGYREIAGIMDCPVDTVKTRMFHARRHLKRRMAGELPDWL
jgi:RNA polymerase sigma-70 factor (ECF subfamily)